MIKLFIDLNLNTFYLNESSAPESFDFEVHVLAEPTKKVKNFNFDFYLQCPDPEIQALLVEEDVPPVYMDGSILNGAGIFARRKYSNLVSGKTYNFLVGASNLRMPIQNDISALPLTIL
jgi:hypothetical protein